MNDERRPKAPPIHAPASLSAGPDDRYASVTRTSTPVRLGRSAGFRGELERLAAIAPPAAAAELRAILARRAA